MAAGASTGRRERRTRDALLLDQGAEETAHQGGVLAEQGEQLPGPDRQADGPGAGPDRLPLPLPAQHRLEAQGEGRRALGGRGPARLDPTAPSSRRCTSVAAAPFRVEEAPGLRPDRPARAGEAEELGHRGEAQERHPAEPVGRHHRGQRLPPARPPGLRAHPARGERPRRRLEDEQVARVAVLEHVLEVVGQPP